MKLMVFSHGKDSSPLSTKIQRLLPIAKELGYTTLVVDYTICSDVEERVLLLEKILETIAYEALFLVGSSMGGYVSLVHANQNKVEKLFLLCPALYLPNYSLQQFSPHCNSISIIHGWQDDVVPVDNSIKFAKVESASLQVVNDNHRLSDSLNLIEQQFRIFFE